MGRRHRMAHAKMLVSLSLLLPYALSYPTTAEGVQVLGNHALLYNGKIYFPLGHLNANAESLRDQDFACKVGQVLLDNVGNHTRSTSQSEQFEWFTRDFYSSNAKPGKATGKTTGKETGKATGKAAGKGTAEDEVECPVYEGESRIPFGTPSFWFYAGISLALVLVGGLMSGLTVGFSSIDPLRLDILMASDLPSDQEDKKRAQKVGPILHDHHKLLVTLLLTNAAAMEALPIFLDRIFPSYVAIILSVTFVLFFGEIIPQALCTKSPLSIGAAWAPFVRLVMTLELPLTYPIAKILDCVLGDDAKRYLFRRSELATLIGFHAVKHMKGGDLREVDEVRIIQGALGLRDVKVKDAMITEIFTMSDDTILSATVMAEIMARGFSRIPIYKDKPQNIVGMLLTKRLILVDPDDEIPVRNILARKPLVVPETMDLYTLLNVFQQKHCHLALVIKDSKDLAAFKNAMSDAKKDVPDHVKITGLITVEDVIEERKINPLSQPCHAESHRDDSPCHILRDTALSHSVTTPFFTLHTHRDP
ncbi:hypothetical protein AAMO2058_001002000 [Amorphochlora amoebiformis]